MLLRLRHRAALLGLFCLLLLAQSGCSILKQSPAGGCPDSLVNEWRYPPSHLTRSLEPSEAEEIIEEEVGMSIRELLEAPVIRSEGFNWLEIKNTHFKKEGSELWRLDSPPGTLGARGIALIHDCEMIRVHITMST